MATLTDTQVTKVQEHKEVKMDNTRKSQWLCHVVVRATNRLVSIVLLMIGVGSSITIDVQEMICFAGHSESKQKQAEEEINYSERSQWLRAAVLGATDGLVSIASLMMGVGAVKKDVNAMILTGFAGLVAGACSMAIGEFVSVCSQLDIEVAQMKRDKRIRDDFANCNEGNEKGKLPKPTQVAAASAFAFMVGAVVPLLAAIFIGEHVVKLEVMAAAVTLALVVFGWLGAIMGGTPVLKSCVRVLIGGWMAMAITWGFTKLIGSNGL